MISAPLFYDDGNLPVARRSRCAVSSPFAGGSWLAIAPIYAMRPLACAASFRVENNRPQAGTTPAAAAISAGSAFSSLAGGAPGPGFATFPPFELIRKLARRLAFLLGAVVQNIDTQVSTASAVSAIATGAALAAVACCSANRRIAAPPAGPARATIATILPASSIGSFAAIAPEARQHDCDSTRIAAGFQCDIRSRRAVAPPRCRPACASIGAARPIPAHPAVIGVPAERIIQ